jgi:hypothetical protein
MFHSFTRFEGINLVSSLANTTTAQRSLMKDKKRKCLFQYVKSTLIIIISAQSHNLISRSSLVRADLNNITKVDEYDKKERMKWREKDYEILAWQGNAITHTRCMTYTHTQRQQQQHMVLLKNANSNLLPSHKPATLLAAAAAAVSLTQHICV